jgi:hypothetical protein
VSSRYDRFLATKHGRWEAATKPRLAPLIEQGEVVRAVVVGVGPYFPWILIPLGVLAYPLLQIRPLSLGAALVIGLVVIGTIVGHSGQRLVVATDRSLLFVEANLLGRPKKIDIAAPLDLVRVTAGEPGAFGTKLTVQTPSGTRRFLVLKGAQPGLPRLVNAVHEHVPPRPI